MITLYSFGPAFNVIDPSPFVAKVDFFLRVSGLEFKSITSVNNLQKAPKGKLPFIDDNGTTISDSYFIIEHLKKTHKVDIDGWLNNEQKATAHLVSKSLEENLYWSIAHSRWVDDRTWPIINAHFFGSLAFPLNKVIPWVARRQVRSNLKAQGLGRHNEQEIEQITHHTLSSLSVMLGDKPYFLGEQISSLDITAYPMISSFTEVSLDNPMNDMAKEFENLLAYTNRIKTKYYPELD